VHKRLNNNRRNDGDSRDSATSDILTICAFIRPYFIYLRVRSKPIRAFSGVAANCWDSCLKKGGKHDQPQPL